MTGGFALDNFRNDAGATADGTSLGQGWTLRHSQAETTDDVTVPSTTTRAPLTVNPVAGDILQGKLVYQPDAGVDANLCITDSLGNVATGYVTTSGTAVTFSSGVPFATSGRNSTGAVWNGLTIKINGTNYTISTVNSFTSITLTTSAGTQATPVPYVGPGPYCSETIQASSSWDTAWYIIPVTTGGADTLIESTAVTGYDDMGFTVEDVYATTGIKGADTAACPVAGCEATTATSNSSTGVLSQSFTPSVGGELVSFGGGGETGAIYASTGNTAILTGTSNAGSDLATSANYYCGTATTRYCSNYDQIVVQTESGTGALTMSLTNLTKSDPGDIQTFGLEPGTGSIFVPQIGGFLVGP